MKLDPRIEAALFLLAMAIQDGRISGIVEDLNNILYRKDV